MNWKYIMLQVTHGKGAAAITRTIPILFPESQTHACVAEAMAKSADYKTGKVEVVSAGEVRMLLDEIRVHGESTSLGLKPNAQDAQVMVSGNVRHGLGFTYSKSAAKAKQ